MHSKVQIMGYLAMYKSQNWYFWRKLLFFTRGGPLRIFPKDLCWSPEHTALVPRKRDAFLLHPCIVFLSLQQTCDSPLMPLHLNSMNTIISLKLTDVQVWQAESHTSSHIVVWSFTSSPALKNSLRFLRRILRRAAAYGFWAYVETFARTMHFDRNDRRRNVKSGMYHPSFR